MYALLKIWQRRSKCISDLKTECLELDPMYVYKKLQILSIKLT